MPDVLSIFLLVFVALLIIGPKRLPQSLEGLWLALTDYQRTQRGELPLGSLYNARRYWISQKSNVYTFIQILYRVTEHLEELRRRLLISVIALGITFGVSFFFAQSLLALVLRPINLLPERQAADAPVNEYILARDTPLTTTLITTSGPVSATITLPRGTVIPLALASTTPVVLHPTELFSTYVKIALTAAFGLSLPVILWQVLMFLRGRKYEVAKLSPRQWQARRALLTPEQLEEEERQRLEVYDGLTAREMRPFYLLTPFTAILFLAGVAFTYFVILPNALDFLFGLGGNLVQPLPSLEDYIGFALALIFWVGLAFETPLIMFFLARFKIISARQFARQWRYAVVLITVIAAVITPTVDAFNMALVALPMFLLYIIGIALARFA